MRSKRSIQLNYFKNVYLKLSPQLVYFASKYVDRITAEDLIHDIFFKLWKEIDQVDSQKNIKSYLFFATKAACIDYIRHQEVHQKYISKTLLEDQMQEITHLTEDDLEEEQQLLLEVYAEIRKLPAKCREVLTLSYIKGLSNDEIALILNLSKRTVESHLYKGLNKLRENLSTMAYLYIVISQIDYLN